MSEMKCLLCNGDFKQLSFLHLKSHNISPQEYKDKFGCEKLIDEDVSVKISYATSGHNNPMFGKSNTPNLGKVFSDEWREKISNTRKQMGIAKGINNPMFGKTHSRKTIEKISETVSKQIINGRRLHSNHHKGYFYSHKLQTNIWYDSSYELLALKILEKHPQVVNFRRSLLKIPYQFNSVEKHTIPDFWVKFKNNEELIIEIKPQRKLEQIKQERIKIEAITNYCMNIGVGFSVWTEKQLKELRS